MTDTANVSPPHEWRAYLFFQIARFYDAVIPAKVRHFVRRFLLGVSPDVPASLTAIWRSANLNAVFLIAGTLTFVACFVVVVVWSALAETLYGNDPQRLYFVHDWVNILNYTLLCPLYVGFGAVLIASSIQGWANLSQLAGNEASNQNSRRSHRAAFSILLFGLLFALISNANFMTEALDPAIYRRTYWFVKQVRPDGSRVIGALGFYYGLLNFCLLLFSVVVGITFISQFRLMGQIGANLDSLARHEPIDTELLRARLTTFTQSYLAGKFAVAAYMANALAWKTTQARHSVNLIAYGAALTFFGVFFLSFPRYYVEMEWYRLRALALPSESKAPDYQDLRPWEVQFVGGSWKPRLWAGLLDTVIIGAFITSFWL
jgi:hypothetical protein